MKDIKPGRAGVRALLLGKMVIQEMTLELNTEK